jgi:MazG family protein
MSFPHLEHLLDILVKLRGPEGCPWDQEQDLGSAARHLSDEVHEYVDSAVEGDVPHVRKELADLLYMVAFNWLLLSEEDGTAFDELARLGAEKLIRRHPHVFGDASAYSSADSNLLWNQIKAQERAEAARVARAEGSAGESTDAGETADPSDDTPPPPSALKDLSPSASPLRQAVMFGQGAASTGFDWPDSDAVIDKLHEELGELQEAQHAEDEKAVAEELGDVLFAVTQLARKLGVDPDVALRNTNRKFADRFRQVESRFGHDPARMRSAGLDELHAAYLEIKARER